MTVLDAIRKVTGGRTLDSLPAHATDQEFLRDAADMGDKRIGDYQLFETYYDGDQATKLTARAKAFLEASGLPYVENYVETIIDAHAGRQIVTGFQVDVGEQPDGDGESEPADPSEWFNDVWRRNAIERDEPVQDVVHHEVYLLGDAFVFVEPDFERDRPSLERQDPHRCKAVYDDQGELEYVVKRWAGKIAGPLNPSRVKVQRMNLYWPDRIEKYFAVGEGDGADWAPWVDTDDEEPVAEVDEETGEEILDEEGDPVPAFDQETGLPLMRSVWPVPWTMDGTPDGEPIGILGVHFKRKAKGRPHGRSKARGIIPQQDALMKALIDLANVGDHAFPVPWAAGSFEKQGNLILNPGELVTFPENTTVGVIQGSDPTPLLNTVEKTLARMAARSQTPAHLVSGASLGAGVAGETIKSTFAPMVAALQDDQGPLGNQWAKLAWLMHRVAVAFDLGDPPALPDEAIITTVWENVEPRDDESEASTLEAHGRIGASKRTRLRKLGYDPDEELEQAREEQQASLDAAQRAFDAGRVPGGEPRPPRDDEDGDDER